MDARRPRSRFTALRESASETGRTQSFCEEVGDNERGAATSHGGAPLHCDSTDLSARCEDDEGYASHFSKLHEGTPGSVGSQIQQ